MNSSKELAYILGVLMGDGSVYERKKEARVRHKIEND